MAEPLEKVFDIEKIMEFLPHRYPFLLVDRVLKLTKGEHITALKNVTINEPFFQGHFPGMPIMPGVLVIEALGQAGAVLVFDFLPEELSGSTIYFMAMDKVKFRKPVVPGDQLFLEAEIIKKRAKTFKLACKAKVDGEVVTEAEVLAMIGDPK